MALSAATVGGQPDPSRTGLLLRAELALALGGTAVLKPSGEALQTWVADHREDATAWQLLAQTTDRQGLKLRALRAEAEAQAALGNLPGAIDRLRAGQQVARQGGAGTDFIEASVIDARLRDLLGQRRALLAEQRKQGNGPQRGDPQE
jgi:predicted Zn-dependent protease